jgi:hypothetical protein
MKDQLDPTISDQVDPVITHPPGRPRNDFGPNRL